MARNIFWILFGMALTVLLNSWGIGPERLAEVINTDAAAEIAGDVGAKLKDVTQKEGKTEDSFKDSFSSPLSVLKEKDKAKNRILQFD